MYCSINWWETFERKAPFATKKSGGLIFKGGHSLGRLPHYKKDNVIHDNLLNSVSCCKFIEANDCMVCDIVSGNRFF